MVTSRPEGGITRVSGKDDVSPPGKLLAPCMKARIDRKSAEAVGSCSDSQKDVGSKPLVGLERVVQGCELDLELIRSFAKSGFLIEAVIAAMPSTEPNQVR